jgi:hypothetical protein
MKTGKFVMGILTRLSISRCAVWAQAEHRKVWRSNSAYHRRVGANVRQAHLSAARQTLHSCPRHAAPLNEAHGGQKSAPRLWWRHTAGMFGGGVAGRASRWGAPRSLSLSKGSWGCWSFQPAWNGLSAPSEGRWFDLLVSGYRQWWQWSDYFRTGAAPRVCTYPEYSHVFLLGKLPGGLPQPAGLGPATR